MQKLLKGQCHEKMCSTEDLRSEKDGPHTALTFFWLTVKLLRYFNCLSSRCETLGFAWFCCSPQTKLVCSCCSLQQSCVVYRKVVIKYGIQPIKTLFSVQPVAYYCNTVLCGLPKLHEDHKMVLHRDKKQFTKIADQ